MHDRDLVAGQTIEPGSEAFLTDCAALPCGGAAPRFGQGDRDAAEAAPAVAAALFVSGSAAFVFAPR